MVKLSKQNVVQFLKYNFGGLLYFWSAWLIITFGTKYIGLWWANLLGNAVGIFLNYLVQRFWAFKPGEKTVLNSGWKFAAITVANLGLSYVILRLLTGLGIELWFAQFISAGFFMFWNWAWYKYWVFKSSKG